MLHKVEINEQGVCLDGKPLKGVRSYRLSQLFRLILGNYSLGETQTNGNKDKTR